MMEISNHEAGDAQGNQGNSGEGDSKGKGIIDLSDVSDDEIYVPSSDSDRCDSDDDCKLFLLFLLLTGFLFMVVVKSVYKNGMLIKFLFVVNK